MKKVFIKQQGGLGDILFAQKIAHSFKNSGYQVMWPVFDSFADISKNIPYFQIYGISEDFPYKEEFLKVKDGDKTIHHIEELDLYIVPIDSSGDGEDIMRTKYRLVNLDCNDWQDYLRFERNHEKEQKLFYDVLGLRDDEPYTFTMKYIGSQPHHTTHIDLKFETDNRIVYLDFYDGYNLFDWCKVLENADEIYIEGSAIMYIAEVLNLKAKKLVLFSRDGHRHFDGILKKPWTLDKASVNIRK